MGQKLNADDLLLKVEVENFCRANHLSAREQDIILLLVNGFGSSEEIARRLKVSVSTVKNHLHSIFQKSETTSKAELLASFIAHNAGSRDQAREANESPLKILIADDDQNFQELIARAIKKLGVSLANVSFVSNGEELMERLEQSAVDETTNPLPDLIVLDLIMPKMDGLKALELIKSNAKMSHIPVVTLTNSDDEETVNKAYSLGGHSYFLKPQTFKDLVDMVAVITTYWSGTVAAGSAQNLQQGMVRPLQAKA
jgi:DNA-binding NarL/FixJ family response regulator